MKYWFFLLIWNKECQSLTIQFNNLISGLHKLFGSYRYQYLSVLNVQISVDAKSIVPIYKYSCDIHIVKKRTRFIWKAEGSEQQQKQIEGMF